ncbi:MAG: hypothetical protein ACAH10_04240 [Methylophilaceae bacterium]|nr:hypothetical protein [Methylotenera sp.]
MNRRYWLVGMILIGLLAVGILEMVLAKYNQKKEIMAASVITTPVVEEIVNKPIEEAKAYIPEEIVCPAQLPDLDKFYKDTPRIKERWDANTIGIVKGYRYSFGKGVLELKPGMVVGGNTPINALRTVLYTEFYFPSLRGWDDPTISDERVKHMLKNMPKRPNKPFPPFPEKPILVSIDRVPDWKNLPMTQEIEFWKTYFKPNLTSQQIAQARKEYQNEVNWIKKNQPNRYIKYVADYEQLGLKEYISGRTGLFYYEPINNTNPSPYGMPRFSCDGPGHLGVGGCVGHIKMDDQYLVTYDIPYELMPCWQQVEEGAKRVLRLNTQVAK